MGFQTFKKIETSKFTSLIKKWSFFGERKYFPPKNPFFFGEKLPEILPFQKKSGILRPFFKENIGFLYEKNRIFWIWKICQSSLFGIRYSVFGSNFIPSRVVWVNGQFFSNGMAECVRWGLGLKFKSQVSSNLKSVWSSKTFLTSFLRHMRRTWRVSTGRSPPRDPFFLRIYHLWSFLSKIIPNLSPPPQKDTEGGSI